MATLAQQQQLIDILAEKPELFNYDITVCREQTLTLTHKLTAEELKEWAEGFCKDYDEDQIPTADDWKNWNQQYLDYLQHGDGWEEVNEWDKYWEDELEHGDWKLDGNIDTWTDKEGE